MHHKKQKLNPTLSEESNKISQKTPSQDSHSDIDWDLDECYRAIRDAANNYDDLVGG